MSDEATETQPEAAPTEAPKRYDILIVSQNRAFNVVEQGLKSLINYLQAVGFVRVYDEAVAEEWTEVYCNAGPTAHEMFVKGPYITTEPLFLEYAIRGGTRPIHVPYGTEDKEETCYFWMEIRGALFQEITGKVKNKLKDLLTARLDYFTRPHEALPPHLVVPANEQPTDKKRRKEGPAARVGTAVEEF